VFESRKSVSYRLGTLVGSDDTTYDGGDVQSHDRDCQKPPKSTKVPRKQADDPIARGVADPKLDRRRGENGGLRACANEKIRGGLRSSDGKQIYFQLSTDPDRANPANNRIEDSYIDGNTYYARKGSNNDTTLAVLSVVSELLNSKKLSSDIATTKQVQVVL
jgi:hypothetical protein